MRVRTLKHPKQNKGIQCVKKPFKQLPPVRTGIASILNVKEPAVRLRDIGNNGKLKMNFNNGMIFPDDIKEQI